MSEGIHWLLPLALLAVRFAVGPGPAVCLFAAAVPFFGAPPSGPYLAPLYAGVAVLAITGWKRRIVRPPRRGLPVYAFAGIAVLAAAPLVYSPPAWTPALVVRTIASLPSAGTTQLVFTWTALATVLLGVGLFTIANRSVAPRFVRLFAVSMALGLAVALTAGLLEIMGWQGLDRYRAILPVLRGRRVFSLFFNPGWFAEYLILVWPIALLVQLPSRASTVLVRTVLFGGSVLSLMLSLQRGSWFAFVLQVSVGATLLIRSRRTGFTLHGMATGFLILLLALIPLTGCEAPDSVADRIQSTYDDSRSRLDLWGAALDLAAERPFLGWGPGTFDLAFEHVRPPGSEGFRRNHLTAHNLYLHIAAEMGVLGVAALLLVTFGFLVPLIGNLNGDRSIESIAFIVSGVGFLSYAVTQYMLHVPGIGFLSWIILGVGWGLGQGDSRPLRWVSVGLLVIGAVAGLLRANIERSSDLTGQSGLGWHQEEVTDEQVRFRWTDQYAAIRMNRKQADLLRITLANGHPHAPQRPVVVAIRVDGVPQPRIELRDRGWQSYEFPVPEGHNNVLVEIRSSSAFRPFHELAGSDGNPPGDFRRLGVAVRSIDWVNSPSPEVQQQRSNP